MGSSTGRAATVPLEEADGGEVLRIRANRVGGANPERGPASRGLADRGKAPDGNLELDSQQAMARCSGREFGAIREALARAPTLTTLAEQGTLPC